MMQYLPLETVVRKAPLAMRFIDSARGVPVHDDLSVTAWQIGQPHARHAALRSPMSGVFGCRALPGLQDYQFNLRPATDWCAGTPADAPNFVVLVEDRAGRFLPLVMALCLPRTELMQPELFSAPARLGVAGMGAVRGQLWDAVGNRAAAWAVIEAQFNGSPVYQTVADARGAFALFVPYPNPDNALPPLNTPPLRWTVTLRVRARPTDLDFIETGVGGPLPEIGSILGQPAAQVFETTAGGASASITRTLTKGADLSARTHGLDADGQPETRLRIVPAP